MEKRGAIELQFNWIFTMIVGALIIAFFIFVINNQMKTADLETQLTINDKLSTMTQTARQNPNSVFEVSLKNIELRTFESCADGMYMGDDRNLRLETEMMFSADLLKTETGRLVLWSVPWEVPFRVTNFMYLTVPDIKYVFINDSEGYAEGLFDDKSQISFPRNITKVITNVLDIGDESEDEVGIFDTNNYKTRVVLFSEDCINYGISSITYDESEVSAVCFEVDSTKGGIDGYGVFYYLTKSPDGPEVIPSQPQYFLGRASVIGAIFAENETQYACQMDKAYKKLEIMSLVYLQRTSTISDYYSLYSDNCDSYGIYDTTLMHLEQIIYDMQYEDPERASDIYYRALSRSGISGPSLKDLNTLSIQKSCAQIY